MGFRQWIGFIIITGMLGIVGGFIYVEKVDASVESLDNFMANDFASLKEAPLDVDKLDWVSYYKPLMKLHDNREVWGLSDTRTAELVSTLRGYKRFDDPDSLTSYLTELNRLEKELNLELESKRKVVSLMKFK